MRIVQRRRTAGLLVLALVGLLAACDGDVVYRDAPPFDAPPAGAGDFLGYSSVSTKRTVCGNCHVGKQAQWQETAHASAFATLASNPNAQATCEGCHTVNARGNISTAAAAGWLATKNERYKDVQCESCHGPGLTHVTNPDAVGTKPLATLAVGVDLSRGCGQCHSGTHQPFAEEWASSNHANLRKSTTTGLPHSRATNASCVRCHEAKGILQAWGVTSTFMNETADNGVLPVTCAVCHDPHNKTNRAQLRFSIETPSTDANLCMKCHQRRALPDSLSTSSGPHSPEGPLLLGEAGWFPPNLKAAPGTLVGSHGSNGNPRLCATCHVTRYEVKDATTNTTFYSTGHSFDPTPCVDASGVPTKAQDCGHDLTKRSFRSCTNGCHLSENAARSALTVAEQRRDRLVAELNGLIARIPATESNPNDGRYTAREGAQFNVGLANKAGTMAHNPFLMESLLIATIKQIELDYGIKPSMSLSLQAQLKAPESK